VAFRRIAQFLAPAGAFALLLLPAAVAQTASTIKVSVGPAGVESNGYSDWPAISADGRVVAFYSYASNLVSDDANEAVDVFVHDLAAGRTGRASVSSSGSEANGASWGQALDRTGRHVAFASHASNLVPDDGNGSPDIFVRDLASGRTELISGRSNGWSHQPSLSGDGRLVVFSSVANNLVPGDTNQVADVFVYDRARGTTSRVSVGAGGQQGDGHSEFPELSANGRFVAFHSDASNLVPGDTNGFTDVFVHDLATHTTRRVSVSSEGAQGRRVSRWPSISLDGRFVAFESESASLVAGDANGARDIFVHDRQSATTTRVSVDSSGTEANSISNIASISADGGFVAFDSWATNLAPGDTNGSYDVFIHDRLKRVTTRVSLNNSRVEADDNSHAAALTPDGRFVAFSSVASNLAGDTNETYDVFVHGPIEFEPGPPPPPPAEVCRVPKLLGLRLAAARTRIRHANCALGRVRRVQSVRVNRVVRQSPKPGTRLPHRSRVNLVVGA
jgi:Tol biopolymer transport system component